MIIYTDGSCRSNPGGPGGFAVIILDDNENLITTHTEYCKKTTNNREELKAILWAFLKYGTQLSNYSIPIIYSDSAYCINTFSSWMFSWANNNWLKSDNKIPENLDLIQPFYKYWQNGYRIKFQKVKGHSNNKWNELADKLAGNYPD